MVAVEKSFGDFEQLQESLIYSEFADVPLLPDLQVSGSIDPLVEVRNAEEELESFIRVCRCFISKRSCVTFP